MGTNLSNKQSISLWRRRHSIKRRLASNKTKLKRLQASVDRDADALRVFDEDDFEIYRGILIDNSWGDRISPVSRDIERDGQWWLNAHNRKTYCFHLRWWDNGRWNEEFMGHYWPNKKMVIKLIKNWIVLGTIPRSVPWRKGKRFSTYEIDKYMRKARC